MEAFQIIAMIVVGVFVLYIIIANAVKVGVREALYDFKEDIIKDINLKKENEVKDN